MENGKIFPKLEVNHVLLKYNVSQPEIPRFSYVFNVYFKTFYRGIVNI